MIRKFEELSMNAWPSLQTKLYDGWILRFSDGYTRRANSVSPLYESAISLDKKIDFCEKDYKAHNLPTIFKLTDDSNPKGIDSTLEERGYTKVNETSLRIFDLSNYTIQEVKDISVKVELSDAWLQGFFTCSEIPDKQTQLTANRILNNILGEVIYVAKEIEGRIVGCGYGAIEGDHIGIFDIAVHKDYRGKGYGKDIITTILGLAKKKNITTAYLQVTVGNTPAEKLYEKIGFKQLYKYWYRTNSK